MRSIERRGEPIFLAGCGRSGTTWLSEVVNFDNAFRIIFEPLRHDTGPTVARMLGYWPYLRPADRPADLVSQMHDVLTGGFSSEWTDRFGARDSNRMLVKEIRANFLLGWLRAAFPSMPMVFILRHPCAVAASEIRLGWTGWDEPMAALAARPDLVGDHLEPFIDVIHGARSTFEQRIVLWCIRNIVPLSQLARGDASVVLYERLLADPMAEMTPLLQALGRPIDEPAIMQAWRRPSAMTMASGDPARSDRVAGAVGEAGEAGVAGEAAWMRSTTADERARAVTILRAFGLDRIYTDDPMPHVAGADVLVSRDTQ